MSRVAYVWKIGPVGMSCKAIWQLALFKSSPYSSLWQFAFVWSGGSIMGLFGDGVLVDFMMGKEQLEGGVGARSERCGLWIECWAGKLMAKMIAQRLNKR